LQTLKSAEGPCCMYTCIRVLVEKHLVSKFSDSKRNQVAETWHVKILQYICSHHSNLYLWFRNRNSVLFFFWSHLPSASALPFPRVPLFSRVEVDTHTHTHGIWSVFAWASVSSIIVPDLPRYKLRMPLLRWFPCPCIHLEPQHSHPKSVQSRGRRSPW